MKNAYRQITNIFLLTLGLALLNTAAAQEMKIDSANPPDAEQGASNKPVDIIGSGFDGTVIDVRFILHCNKKNCPDTGDIVVNDFVVDSETLIKTDISVLLEAPIADYDITVTSSRGRGGKGTTYKGVNKFSVKTRPNQNIVSCDVFAPNGTCTCQFGGGDGGIHTMLGDCETSETLWTGTGHHQIWGPSQTNPGTLRVVNCDPSKHTTNPLDPYICNEAEFKGSSVISNTDHRAGVKNVIIEFDDAVSRGCAPEDDIESAVSFRLHGGITVPPTGNSFIQIVESVIDSHMDPLCTAVEIVREPAYTSNHPEGKDWKVKVVSVDIADDSYVTTGVRYEGIKPQHSLNPPIVFGNTIGFPACAGDDPLINAAEAIGIQFGPVLLSDSSDPSSQIAGIAESNIIRMTTNCGTLGGVGILVVGEPCNDEPCIDVLGDPVAGDQTVAEVTKNDISGALNGILTDHNVVDVKFSGNTLIGIGEGDPAIFDIGINSGAQCTRTKGKPNNISGYDIDLVGDCP